MKKLISLVIAITMMLSLCCAEEFAGGWSAYTGSGVPAEAMKAYETAFDSIDGSVYEPVQLLGTQLVAGTNYSCLCRVTDVYPGAEPYWTVVTVYADLEGNAEITGIEYIALGYESYDAGYDGRADIVIVTPELNYEEQIDFLWGADGTQEEIFMLDGGLIFVDLLRTPLTEAGLIAGLTEAEFLQERYGDLNNLISSAYINIGAYPSVRYTFTSGSEEDTEECDLIFFYTDEWAFCAGVMCDSDAYHGYSDADAAEIQGFAEKLYQSIELVEAVG